jgi:hypothetical protein
MVDRKSQKESAAESRSPTKKTLCFVIGPIGKLGTPTRDRADFLLEGVIRYVLETEEFGYQVRRADEDARPGMISDRVLHDVREAELVIADLTDLNANAFYELAIRHLTEKPTIHMTNDIGSLPFDNIGHAAIPFDLTTWPGILAARSSLAASVRATQAEDFKISNPVTQANALFKPKGSADLPSDMLIDLRDRLRQLERAMNSANSFRGTGFRTPAAAERNVLSANNFSDMINAIVDAIPSGESELAAAGMEFLDRLGITCNTAASRPGEVTFMVRDGPAIRVRTGKFPPSMNDLVVEFGNFSTH